MAAPGPEHLSAPAWRLALTGRRDVLEPLADRFSAAGAPLTLFEVDEKRDAWILEVYLAAPPSDLAEIEAAATVAALEPLPQRDWVAESQRQLPPVRAGRFYVHGSHDRRTAPAGAVALEIEAGPAFGSGLHGTTQGCLLLLDQLLRRRRGRAAASPTSPVLSAPPADRRSACFSWRSAYGRPAGGEARKGDGFTAPSPPLGAERVGVRWGNGGEQRSVALDLGCGSGVLALAYAKAARRPVIATDIDRQAVLTTQANARLNRLARHVRTAVADGLGHRPLRRRRFDPILANILARPLIALAPELARRLPPGGDIVLSGLLRHQALPVLLAYRRRGLRLMHWLDRGEWTSLWLHKE